MAWLAIPFVVGLGVALVGCGSSNSEDAAAAGDGGTSPNASGSSYAPAMPPPVGSGLPPARPNPLLTRAAPLDIGAAPAGANAAAITTWAGETAIDRRYIPEYNQVYPGLYSERRVAIRETIRLIDSETRANPLRVTYQANGTPNTVTIDDPLAIFVQRLVATSPEGIRDEVRREAEAAIRERRGPSGSDAPPPRPVASDRPARPAGTAAPRPAGPPADPFRPTHW